MAYRTTGDKVADVLGDDYGKRASDAKLPSLLPYIRMANTLVNRVKALASGGSGVTVLGNIASDSDALELVETLLAAHFYCMNDKPLQSKSSGGASGSFQGQTGQGFTATMYGQNAMRMDYSRILSAIDTGKFAGLEWAGKPTSEQLDWEARGNS